MVSNMLDLGRAGTQDHDPVRKLDRFIDIVGHKDDGSRSACQMRSSSPRMMSRVTESSAPKGSSR